MSDDIRREFSWMSGWVDPLTIPTEQTEIDLTNDQDDNEVVNDAIDNLKKSLDVPREHNKDKIKVPLSNTVLDIFFPEIQRKVLQDFIEISPKSFFNRSGLVAISREYFDLKVDIANRPEYASHGPTPIDLLVLVKLHEKLSKCDDEAIRILSLLITLDPVCDPALINWSIQEIERATELRRDWFDQFNVFGWQSPVFPESTRISRKPKVIIEHPRDVPSIGSVTSPGVTILDPLPSAAAKPVGVFQGDIVLTSPNVCLDNGLPVTTSSIPDVGLESPVNNNNISTPATKKKEVEVEVQEQRQYAVLIDGIEVSLYAIDTDTKK